MNNLAPTSYLIAALCLALAAPVIAVKGLLDSQLTAGVVIGIALLGAAYYCANKVETLFERELSRNRMFKGSLD